MSNLVSLLYDYSRVLFMIIFYLVSINLTAFLLILIDKYKAKRDQWRIKELIFIILSILGGSIGVIIGMVVFRHKTNKRKFYLGIPLIYIVNIITIIIVLNKII